MPKPLDLAATFDRMYVLAHAVGQTDSREANELAGLVVQAVDHLRSQAAGPARIAAPRKVAVTAPPGQFVVTVAFGVDRVVKSLREASTAVEAYIMARGWGGSQWYAPGVGLVRDHKGKVVAKISYNGRAWAVDKSGKETGKEIVL